MKSIVVLAALGCLGVPAPFALAGPLSPPTGPVASTGRFGPRIEINAQNTPGDSNSTFRIAASGSYYLADNVDVFAGDSGVEIAASGVTIDLNGFVIREAPLQGATLDGLVAFAGVRNVVVRNGMIRGLNGDGIDLGGARGCLIDGLSVRSCGGVGVKPGADARVIDCSSSENGGNGVESSSNCVLQGCIAELNGGIGFQLSFSCIAEHCAANANMLSGFSSGVGSSLVNCTALSNTTTGISLGGGSRASACAAYLNGSSGITCSSGAMIESCASRDNTGAGFVVGTDCLVTGCSSNSNNSHGFLLSGDQSQVRGNSSTTNVGNGFNVSGNSNLLDQNSSMNNAIGLWVTGCNNWVLRNLVIQNSIDGIGSMSNCNPLTINKVAPMELLPFDAAISPWANFDDAP